MLACILRQNALLSLAGAVCCCLSCFIYDRAAFLLAFVLGALLLFVCTAGINLCTMLAVPPTNRSFAIAVRYVGPYLKVCEGCDLMDAGFPLCNQPTDRATRINSPTQRTPTLPLTNTSTLCIHALGDVPSPIVVGALLDRMAPACAADLKQNGDGDKNGGTSNGAFVVSPECEAQIPSVRWTLFLVCAWLSITVACFAAAWTLASRQHARHHPKAAVTDEAAATAGGSGAEGWDEKRRPLLQGEGGHQGRGREIVL